MGNLAHLPINLKITSLQKAPAQGQRDYGLGYIDGLEAMYGRFAFAIREEVHESQLPVCKVQNVVHLGLSGV